MCNAFKNESIFYIEEILMKLNISFSVKNDEFLEKYNGIWDKVSYY